MTVSELIEKLQKFKGDTVVCIDPWHKKQWYDVEAGSVCIYTGPVAPNIQVFTKKDIKVIPHILITNKTMLDMYDIDTLTEII